MRKGLSIIVMVTACIALIETDAAAQSSIAGLVNEIQDVYDELKKGTQE